MFLLIKNVIKKKDGLRFSSMNANEVGNKMKCIESEISNVVYSIQRSTVIRSFQFICNL